MAERRFLPHLSAILCLQAVLGFAYLRRVAIYNAPDEPAHVRYIETLDSGRLPVREADRWSYKGAEPPLYYALSALLDAPTLFRTISGRVAALRFINVLLGLATTAFVYLFGVRVAGERTAVYAAAFSALLPQHLFTAATLGNDELAAALSACALWLAARELYKRRRSWLGPATGALLGLAALSRASALAVAAAYAVCALEQSRRDARGAGRLAALPLGLALLVCGWFYERNARLYGSPFGWTPSAAASGLGDVDGRWLAIFAESSVGLFAWMASPLPAWCYAGAFLALAAGAAGFTTWAAKERPWRLEPAWKLSLAAAVFVAVFAGLEALATRQPQGRLLLPALGPIALIMVCGWRALSWRLSPSARALGLRAAFAAVVLLHYRAFLAL